MEANTNRSHIMAEAAAALAAGDAARARSLLSQEMPVADEDAAYLWLKGEACCKAGFAEEGLTALERVVELTGTAQAHYELANGYRALNRVPEAITEYEWALKLEPEHPRAAAALHDLRPNPPGTLRARPTAAADDLQAAPAPSGPRTPEQIAMDEWDEEQRLRRIRNDYILSGARYGAYIGGIFVASEFILVTVLSGIAGMINPYGGGGSMLAIFAQFISSCVIGAAFGGLVGAFVASRDGGSIDGAVAGALALSLPVLLLRYLPGADVGLVSAVAFANLVLGGMSGALIGYLTRMSIDI